MARRKDHSREELTQLAIEAGRQLVVRNGPAALTARNVAKEIGYTPGTLYNIFENIDALAAAINIVSMDAFAEKLANIIECNSDSPTRLREVSQAYLDFHKEEPHLWSLLFALPIDHHSEPYTRAIHRIFDQVTECIEPLCVDSESARRKAKVLWSTLHGICLLAQSGKLNVHEKDTPEALTQEFLKIFIQN